MIFFLKKRNSQLISKQSSNINRQTEIKIKRKKQKKKDHLFLETPTTTTAPRTATAAPIVPNSGTSVVPLNLK